MFKTHFMHSYMKFSKNWKKGFKNFYKGNFSYYLQYPALMSIFVINFIDWEGIKG